MKKHSLSILFLSMSSFYASAERIVVEFDPSSKGNIESLINKKNGEIKVNSKNFISANFNGKSINEIKGLLNNPHIKNIEIDNKRFLNASFSDTSGSPYQVQVTPYSVIQSEADKVYFNPNAMKKVCIIDTGLELTHSDLSMANIDGSNDSVSGYWNENGGWHGTHVAGTIAALDNGLGVIGMAPGVSLHIIKTFNENGWAYSSDLAHAASLCSDAGADIISMSLSGPSGNSVEEDAFRQFSNNGGLVIASAGNNGDNSRHYPAGYSSVVMIGANDKNGNIATFSQHPSCLTGRGKRQKVDDSICVELSAGGVDVLSTYLDNGYAYASGTSMSAPAVSGIAALVWSNFENCTGSEIRNALKVTASDHGASGHDDYFGYGIVQAAKASEYLQNNVCEADSVDIPDVPSSDDLTLNGYKSKGSKYVELTWYSLSGNNVDIYRNNSLINTVDNSNFYSDSINSKGGGTYSYQVCETLTQNCTSIVEYTF